MSRNNRIWKTSLLVGLIFCGLTIACQPVSAPSPLAPPTLPASAAPTLPVKTASSPKATPIPATPTVSPTLSVSPTLTTSAPLSPLHAELVVLDAGKVGETAQLQLTLTSPFDSDQVHAQFVLPPGVSLVEGQLEENFSLTKAKPHVSTLTIRLDQIGIQQIIGGGTMQLNDAPVGNWAEVYLHVSESGTTVTASPIPSETNPNPQGTTPVP